MFKPTQITGAYYHDRGARSPRAAVCLLLCALLFLTACRGGRTARAEPPPMAALPAAEGLRIAVASDLHLNPDSRPHSENPAQYEYNLELVDALLWDAARQGASFLLLTGDLVNGGKPYRHEALIEKLAAAEAEGLPVYVLPGNHDLAPVTQTEFAELYRDFGYGEAISRDPASLSYCVVRDGLMLLMMDTAGYSVGAIDLPGAPAAVSASNPFLTEDTLRWAEAMLQEAREEGLRVLCAGHYNLLSPISRDPGSEGYYLENGEAFSALLREYRAPLYLSGHTHVRAVYQEDGLTELTTEYLLSYPTACSLLDLTDDGIRYTPRRIDVDAWAQETGQSDPLLLNYAQWQQEELRRYAETNISYMAERNPLSGKQRRQAAEFFYFVMDAYWQGTLHTQRAAAEAMPGYESFFRCAEGYAYGWWLKDLLETASPELAGFHINWISA